MRMRHPTGPHESMPVSLPAYYSLQDAARNSGHKMEDWEVLHEAIDQWMRRHEPELLAGPATAGYQWKQLFLPDGTVLRTVFGGKNHSCVVSGDAIEFEGRSVSPSGFVNAAGGVRRNAWKCTWILLPDSKQWKLADTLRTRERPRRTISPIAGPERQAERSKAPEAHAIHTMEALPGAAPPAGPARHAPATAASASRIPAAPPVPPAQNMAQGASLPERRARAQSAQYVPRPARERRTARRWPAEQCSERRAGSSDLALLREDLRTLLTRVQPIESHWQAASAGPPAARQGR